MMSIKKEANKIASFCGIKVESRDTFIRKYSANYRY